MLCFVVESYLAWDDHSRQAVVARVARALAADETVRHAGSLGLLEDEICRRVFEAASAAALVEASARAGLEHERVVAGIWLAGTPARHDMEPV